MIDGKICKKCNTGKSFADYTCRGKYEEK